MSNPILSREIISTRIAIARKNAGLTQGQVAKLLNIPRPSISEIEAGRRRVSAEELVQFADVFCVDIDWLAGKGERENDSLRDELQLAARNLAALKPEDIDKVVNLLLTLKKAEG